ncbi:uncharacterized protein LOC123691860 [Colias croceus]|uniref:uncharacterized protein LOC123691860 n=1 Tax=Colias crocea TaxID=72248 RepID=UPI001E280D93|nr:uncharacterized protein LOC123691860 [Colias croceus]
MAILSTSLRSGSKLRRIETPSKIDRRACKIYKSCVRKNSPHHQLWTEALQILKSIKFLKSKKDNKDQIYYIDCTVPSISNFIRTIEGIQYLWKILSEKYAFDAMLTRNFNQDPLENFFGNIRSYGVRNTAPNTIHFEGAYKSLLLNNFNTPHSVNSNCENDDNNVLHSLDFFLKEQSNVPNDEALLFQSASNEGEEIVVPQINIDCDPKDVGQANYVCGWVLSKCLKNISKDCKICKKDMVGDKNTASNAYIRCKEYKISSHCLVYPSKGMEKGFIQLQEIVTGILKENVPKSKIKDKIYMLADILVEYPFTCNYHQDQLKKYFNNTVANVLIYSWCRTINRILSGKIKYDGEDEIKLAAQAYYVKHTKFNKCNK